MLGARHKHTRLGLEQSSVSFDAERNIVQVKYTDAILTFKSMGTTFWACPCPTLCMQWSHVLSVGILMQTHYALYLLPRITLTRFFCVPMMVPLPCQVRPQQLQQAKCHQVMQENRNTHVFWPYLQVKIRIGYMSACDLFAGRTKMPGLEPVRGSASGAASPSQCTIKDSDLPGRVLWVAAADPPGHVSTTQGHLTG